MRSPNRKLSRGKRATALLLLVIGIILVYWSGIFIALRQDLLKGGSDFSDFYSAGKIVLSGNSSQIYDSETQRQAQKPFFLPGTVEVLLFVFPPYILIIFVPLAMLSYSHAVIVWYVISIAMLLAVPFLLRDRLGMNDKQLALSLLGLSFFFPITVALASGQPTILTLLLFTLVFLQLGDGHDFRAGCILALAMYKPQFVIPLLLALAITRNWSALRGFLATCFLLLGLSVALVGWHTTLRFPRAVIAFQGLPAGIGGEHPERMPNLRGLLQWLLDSRLSHSHVLVIAAGASALVALCLILAGLARQRRISELNFSLVIVVTILSSYHGYKYDMPLLVLAFLLVAHYVAEADFSGSSMLLSVSAALVFIIPSLFQGPASVVAMLLFSVVLFAENLRLAALAATANVPKLERADQ